MSATETIRRLELTPAAGARTDVILDRRGPVLPHLAWHLVVDIRLTRATASEGFRFLARLQRLRKAGLLAPRIILRIGGPVPEPPPRLDGCAEAVILEGRAAGWARAVRPGPGLRLFRVRPGRRTGARGWAGRLAECPDAVLWIEADTPPRGTKTAARWRDAGVPLERVLWRTGRGIWYWAEGRWAADRLLFDEGALETTLRVGRTWILERADRSPVRIAAGRGLGRSLAAALGNAS